MFLIANLSKPEITVAIAGTALMATAGLVALVRWFTTGPEAPDPWGEDIKEKIALDGTPPLCHRCLLPNPPETDFCRHCGATVGMYTNLLPLPYIYSVGDTLRLGTSGAFRRTPLTVAGFWLLGLAEYSIFAPVYWYRLARGRSEEGPYQQSYMGTSWKSPLPGSEPSSDDDMKPPRSEV